MAFLWPFARFATLLPHLSTVEMWHNKRDALCKVWSMQALVDVQVVCGAQRACFIPQVVDPHNLNLSSSTCA